FHAEHHILALPKIAIWTVRLLLRCRTTDTAVSPLRGEHIRKDIFSSIQQTVMIVMAMIKKALILIMF
ncbi:MAG: hypothetical protein PHS98_02425, partial [Bacilli bacterium]|nr:hypothetical protein [Bacilli bacterium]